jgi:hypothetical protein
MEVRWSKALHVYTPASSLNDFLADLVQLTAPRKEAEPIYLAIRFGENDWYVLAAGAAGALRRQLASYHAETGFRAKLGNVAPQVKGFCVPAFVLSPGRSRTVEMPLRPEIRDCYAIELDARGEPMRVGELRALAREIAPPSATRSPPSTRAMPRSAEDDEAVRKRQIEQQTQQQQQAHYRHGSPLAPARFEYTWPEGPNDSSARRGQRAEPPEPSGPRYIQGDLFRKAGEEWVLSAAELALKHAYRFDVFIGPSGLGSIQADAAFRDDALDWKKADTYRLQVIFAETSADAEAQSAHIDLPRTGRSSTCSFFFSPKRLGLFHARISVMHEGRVLQTALIATVVEPLPRTRETPGQLPALRPAVEMVVRHELDSLADRRHFDACLILNHSSTGSPALTAASKDGAYVSSLDDLQAQLASISTLLVELATKSKIHTKGLTTKENAAWLGRLAAEGNFLYRKLVVDYIGRSPAAEALKKAEYLQIVSARPDSVVPLEFVYEYPPPKDGAPVCENAAQALKDGKCPANCLPKKGPADRVCPLGFWGLSRVIERHVHDPRLGAPALIRGTEPTAERGSLEVNGASLLAISEQVKKPEQKRLSDRIKQSWKGGVSIIESWQKWPEAVGKAKPVLFVVLPHTKGKGAQIALEIHGDALESRFIERSYVYPEGSTGSPPIVMLLGCDTSNTADKDAYTTHIAVFRQAGSAVVLATTAALVWGEDSAKVAAQVVEALSGAIAKKPQCFGDILRTAKRRSVADSQLMAICLAAFGDADWRLSLN